jgi:hypothetical protein
MASAASFHDSRLRWVGSDPPARRNVEDLVAQFPTHVPMGLPLDRTHDDDRPDAEYSL